MTEPEAMQKRRQFLLEQLSRAKLPMLPKTSLLRVDRWPPIFTGNSGATDMKKCKSRTRIARRDILRGMHRTRERVRDLQPQKQSYDKAKYDGYTSEGAGGQDQFQ